MEAKKSHVMSSVVLTISGRTVGGEDVLISKLLHMYAQYAESQGWRIQSVPTTGSPIEPLKEVVTLINGENAYRKLRYENGVHRIQWVPTTEQEGRVFTAKLVVTVADKEGSQKVLGTADRNIRTYNIPQNRATDHRIGLTLHRLDLVMDGDLEPIIQALTAYFDEGDNGSGA
jgi:protein subunit release factor A